MNAYMKLRERYTNELCKANDKALGRFFARVGKLQNEDCEHEKTHWVQEIDNDGEFKDGLVKRCINCCSTLDKIDATKEEVESLLDHFDVEAEILKLSKPVLTLTISNEKLSDSSELTGEGK